MNFTHFDAAGRSRMVDVGGKEDTVRVAEAHGFVRMQRATLTAIREGMVGKGDVLAVAQVAAVMGAKQTAHIIPMCHPLLLTEVGVRFELQEAEPAVRIIATVKTNGKTGVEMEALTAVSIAALTIYDMCKSLDKGMVVDGICLLHKIGGKSGEYHRGEG